MAIQVLNWSNSTSLEKSRTILLMSPKWSFLPVTATDCHFDRREKSNTK